MHVLASTPFRHDDEFCGLGEPFVEVKLDAVGLDATKWLFARLGRRLEEGDGTVTAARRLGPDIQLSAPLLDELDRLRRALHEHTRNGSTTILSRCIPLV